MCHVSIEGSGDIAPLIPNLNSRWKRVPHTHWSLVGPQNWCGWFGESLDLAGIRIPGLQHVA